MKILRSVILFYIGGTAYMILEFLWRGRSHGSMFLLGGLCFLLVGGGGNKFRRIPLPFRLLLGSGIITTLELATGLVCNRDYQVWDYRGVAGNLWGQICPLFSLLWIPVALGAIGLYALLARSLEKIKSGKYLSTFHFRYN